MRLTVTTLSDHIFTLEVGEDLDLASFKGLCEIEVGVPAHQIAILWNGRPLHDDKLSLKQYGINNGDMLLLQQIQGQAGQTQGTIGGPSGVPQIDFGSIQLPGQSSGGRGGGGGQAISRPGQGGEQDPASIRQMFLNNPHQMALLKERNPPLANALTSGNLEEFTKVFREQQEERRKMEQARLELLTANPFDPDVQKRIAEEIRMKNVESNMETAIEFAPESFGQVVMLYVDCMVNGYPVKAFVDSGAQMTIMSQACAERCHIMRLVDTRWAGVAKGVGTQKIIGRVHLCQIQIGPHFFQSSFSILEDQPMDMLLGLDMLKRHQCIIDLQKNVLKFGTTGTEAPFLSESQLPQHARLNNTHDVPMDEDQQLAQAISKSQAESASKAGEGSGVGPSTSTATPMSTGPSLEFSESNIKKLMDHGFTRAAVMEELRRANGNMDQALAALLAKSLSWQ
ncbi:protein DDI1 homolog 2-like [Babylonia areolata]|uniref:protein DDI1 homolog 2-like n=1 Tax=Babylonia areolata TaxID=304850 RepID=UPI003FD5AECA